MIAKIKRTNDELKASRPTKEEVAKIPRLPISILVENVRSVHNVGSIFRSADGFGASKIYLTGYTACPPREDITKTALGADKVVPWEHYKNPIEAAKKISSKFDDNYWLDLDLKSEFPSEFYNEVAKSGWLGICMPEEYGGANLGIQEAALFMQNITRNGGGMSAASVSYTHLTLPTSDLV